MKKYLLALLPVLGLGIFFAPAPTHALTATLDSVSPEPSMDLTDQLTLPSIATGNGYIGTVDETYTLIYSVDESPAMVVSSGGEMNLDQNWNYDATTGKVTITITNVGAESTEGPGVPEGDAIFVVALVGAVAQGEDGPPAEMTGAWLSTNILSWELVPPSPDAPFFGFILSGPEGTDGFLHMYIPSATIGLISGFVGKTLTPADMAVFENDDQSSTSITDVDGNAYIDINVTFTEDITTPTTSSTTVVKEITTGEKQTVSLAATKYSVSKGAKTKLYGWLKSGAEGKTVTVWRKLKGEDEYTKIETLTTEADGYFHTRFTVNKTARYKIKYKRNSGATARYSTVQKVTVQ